jgi:L-threonylcarbamoyladenylate synthase
MAQRLQYTAAPAATLQAAADVIRRGGIVVFPTETFYGLAVDPASDVALQRLATLKDRAGTKPIPVIAASRAECARLAPMPEVLVPLCQMFWPGPLTVALEPYASWPLALLGGGKTLGVRVSSHPVAQELAAAAGGLITSTSANPNGKPPADRIAALDPLIASQVDLIIDAGALTGGLASTVVFARGDEVVLLRPGAITDKDLQRVLGRAPVLL